MKQRDIVRLSAATDVSLGTVRKWASGGRVTDANRRWLEQVAASLGIQVETKEGENNAG